VDTGFKKVAFVLYVVACEEFRLQVEVLFLPFHRSIMSVLPKQAGIAER